MRADFTRRRALAAALSAVGAAGWPGRSRAAGGQRRVAILSADTDDQKLRYRVLIDALAARGWSEGDRLGVDIRYADADPARARSLAAELLARRPDVFVVDTDVDALPVAKATRSVPIVFVLGTDPVGLGLAKSLARPGSNVTGLAISGDEVAARRLDLIRQTVPALRRVGVLLRQAGAHAPEVPLALQRSAAAIGLELAVLPIRSRDDLAPALVRAAQTGLSALIGIGDALLLEERRLIAEQCLKNRLASVFGPSEFADAGALFAYGPDFGWVFSRAAEPIDRILRGARPGEIPIEKARVFELVVNLATARQLGLTVPDELLPRATRVIE
jgi:putative ABC transport system substrate-binding protein